MTIRTLEQLHRDWEREALRQRQVLASWPNLPTIRLDDHFARSDEVTFIAYCYFPGRVNDQHLCSQLVITDDPKLAQLAERDPALCNVPDTPSRLRTPLNQAIYRTIQDLGGDRSAAECTMRLLRPFGIDRSARSWARTDRVEELTGLQERVTTILHRVFLDLLDRGRDPMMHGRIVDPHRANPSGLSRSRAGQTARHGQSLRSAA